MKFWHVTVMEGYTTLFTRKCLSVGEANALFEEKKKEFPTPKYQVLKENY